MTFDDAPAPRPGPPGCRDPRAEARFRRGQAALADGALAEAAEMTEQALALDPGWTGAWVALAAIRRRAGEGALAAAAAARALALDPADRHGAALVAAAGPPDGPGGAPATPAAAPDAYVAALFDAYAPRFEAHLTGALGYDGPAALVAALRDAGHARFGRALDLGCGTGLCGRALRPHATHLAGVDLSPAMVALAAAKRAENGAPLYDRLHVGPLGGVLAGAAAGALDTITAADVFIYCGDLRPVLAAAARALAPGGALAFTVQTGTVQTGTVRTGTLRTDAAPGDETAPGYHVGADMRFHHAPSFLDRALAAAGLATRVRAARPVRRERDAPVPGLVVVAVKP